MFLFCRHYNAGGTGMHQDKPITRREIDVALATFETWIVAESTSVMRDIGTNLLTACHSTLAEMKHSRTAWMSPDRELGIRRDEWQKRVIALEARRPPSA